MNSRLAMNVLSWISLALLCCSPVPAEDHTDGKKIYLAQCASCHGANGEGVKDKFAAPLTGDRSLKELAEYIDKTMPEGAADKCVGEDAQRVAAYIYDGFYSPLAQARNMPARVDLSRLTVRQHQQTLADLIESFRWQTPWGQERGLKGTYYNSRNEQKEHLALERVDPTIEFDFGEGSPLEEKIDPSQFFIKWEGSVIAPTTGDYEFGVRTQHSVQLWVNDEDSPIIDGLVRSGEDHNLTARKFLLGGRAYPVRLRFSKAKQGVDDSKTNKPKPVAAELQLKWKPPHEAWQTVPTRCLIPKRTAEVYVVATPFPPDDRSVGYERGVSVSFEWAQAASDAAVATAKYVSDNLNRLANTKPKAEDREKKIREFVATFVERAFRHPLSDDEKRLYVDRIFEEANDLELGANRIILLALGSPRFLYREIESRGDAWDTASKLSYGLWDSMPDKSLVKAASSRKLESANDLRRIAGEMMGDTRARYKLREFLRSWLRVDQPLDLAKDPQRFPEFNDEIESDLRVSLELTLDEWLVSDGADFRELLLSDDVFLNRRLAAIYGGTVNSASEFEKVSFSPKERAGILSHPYLMSSFAYTATSSPIHRGVFIARSLLGRRLRPPPEAVAPLAPDLHASLTTRERVMLQTKPEACQSCHAMINPLGFTLENFDALGRYRDREGGRPVIAEGSYRTRTGEVEEFQGIRELAEFLSTSEETHQAFVEQLFQYLVKQPIRAYGETVHQDLTKRFAENQFNVRKLAIEIAAISAAPVVSNEKQTSNQP